MTGRRSPGSAGRRPPRPRGGRPGEGTPDRPRPRAARVRSAPAPEGRWRSRWCRRPRPASARRRRCATAPTMTGSGPRWAVIVPEPCSRTQCGRSCPTWWPPPRKRGTTTGSVLPASASAMLGLWNSAQPCRTSASGSRALTRSAMRSSSGGPPGRRVPCAASTSGPGAVAAVPGARARAPGGAATPVSLGPVPGVRARAPAIIGLGPPGLRRPPRPTRTLAGRAPSPVTAAGPHRVPSALSALRALGAQSALRR